MSVHLNPYLNFPGHARTALEHYRTVFGGELTLLTFAEGGMSSGPDDADLVMHGQLATADFTFMAADTPGGADPSPGSVITMALTGDDDATLSGWFARLAEDGGTVTVPLEKAPWGDRFGMVTDRFGIAWMVNVSGTG
jgi:PhnB protein